MDLIITPFLQRSILLQRTDNIGAIQVLRNADEGGGVKFSGKNRYEGVRFNVISVTRGVGGGPISRKKVLCDTWMAPLWKFFFLMTR